MRDRSKNNSIYCTIRSYVSPANPPQQFELGKGFTQRYPGGTTLKSVIESLLGDSGQIGVIAVNGKLVKEWERTLEHGDRVDIFPLIGGG